MSSYQCLTTTVDDTSQATGKVYMRAREASASEGRASGGGANEESTGEGGTVLIGRVFVPLWREKEKRKSDLYTMSRGTRHYWSIHYWPTISSPCAYCKFMFRKWSFPMTERLFRGFPRTRPPMQGQPTRWPEVVVLVVVVVVVLLSCSTSLSSSLESDVESTAQASFARIQPPTQGQPVRWSEVGEGGSGGEGGGGGGGVGGVGGGDSGGDAAAVAGE